ncbi:MAG: zinc-binding dehydrogenase [Flavobacteriia bacterium]|nr:zinc-binding dehydrogenase [Flavobacteriia bacterium]
MEKIKTEAIVLVQKGKPEIAFKRLVIELNSLKANEVLIETEAFGLNYADVMARNGLYKEAPAMPCVIGYEVVGTIIQIGKNVDSKWLGERVLAFSRFGGYAKKVISTDQAIVVINDLNSSVALALCTQSVTAFYMVSYIAPIYPGEKVLIHAAAGGVGSILIQLAKYRGATVFAKIGDDNKRELVEKLGADYSINYNHSNYSEQIETILKGSKLDISYNPIGGSSFKDDLKLLGAGGKLFLYGGAALSGKKWGFFSQLNFVKKMGLVIPIGLMMTSKNILGINMLKIADQKPEVLLYCLQQVVELYKKGIIQPQIGGEFQIDSINQAHTLLESGKSMGKITVKW